MQDGKHKPPVYSIVLQDCNIVSQQYDMTACVLELHVDQHCVGNCSIALTASSGLLASEAIISVNMYSLMYRLHWHPHNNQPRYVHFELATAAVLIQ